MPDIKPQYTVFYLSQKVDKGMSWLLTLIQLARWYYPKALHV